MTRPFDIVFPEASAMMDMHICPMCGVGISENDFRDAVSLREWKISGMCQDCQDEIFNPDY